MATVSDSNGGSNDWGAAPARWGWGMLAVLLGLFVLDSPKAASISEPATVFYGKIIGTDAVQPFLVTEGDLEWTVRRADGTELTLHTFLGSYNQGEYSYRLDVPHEALALGLENSEGVIPLTAGSRTLQHLGITVNDLPARIVGPNGSSFNAAQARRAATYRLDLEVSLQAADSDGDGIPDWWEDQYGLDKQEGSDGAGDADADGESNLNEYLTGSDPTHDSRRPELITQSLIAYAHGTTGIYLRTLDTDSAPEQLVYTLIQAPETDALSLQLRNAQADPVSPDVNLESGSEFTQQDIVEGRLVLVHTEPEPGVDGVESSAIEVSVRDEDPAHEPVTGTIELNLYRPPDAILENTTAEERLEMIRNSSAFSDLKEGEARRLRNYLLGKELDYVIWDAGETAAGVDLSAPSAHVTQPEYELDYLLKFGSDRSHVLVGGSGPDNLAGGMQADHLIGGLGPDQLRGNGGGDRFVFYGSDPDPDTIMDFNPAEGDVLDLSRVLTGQGYVQDTLQLTRNGEEWVLGIDAEGDGDGFSDRVIRLSGLAEEDADLYQWAANGQLDTGPVQIMPRVSVTTGESVPAENGPVSGEFVLRRTGELDAELTINLAIGGSAENGVDYAKLDSAVTFPEGAGTVSLPLMPYADTQSEPAESVEITIQPGSEYAAGESNRAVLTIADLQAVVSIEALESRAVKNPRTPAAFLVSRRAIVDQSVLVRLEIGGSASGGSDYETLLRFVNFDPGQTTELLEIRPIEDGELNGGAETVEVSILPDPTYRTGHSARARVTIVERETTLAAWRQTRYPDAGGDLQSFAAADPGELGLPNLLRYAFGLDPDNPDRTRLPRAVIRDGHLTLDVWRRPDATDIELVVEVSNDLLHWESSGERVQRIQLPELADEADRVCYRALPSVRQAPDLYMRVRVIYQP